MKVRSIRLRPRALLVNRGTGWGGVWYYRKHATWPATPADLALTARSTSFEDMYDKAYMRAYELDSPNPPDFDSLVDSILDELEETT